MSAAQNGACAICGAMSDLVIDHCHKTGRIRGLLCGYCNVALGHARDDIEWLARAAEYLRKYAEADPGLVAP